MEAWRDDEVRCEERADREAKAMEPAVQGSSAPGSWVAHRLQVAVRTRNLNVSTSSSGIHCILDDITCWLATCSGTHS